MQDLSRPSAQTKVIGLDAAQVQVTGVQPQDAQDAVGLGEIGLEDRFKEENVPLPPLENLGRRQKAQGHQDIDRGYLALGLLQVAQRVDNSSVERVGLVVIGSDSLH